VDERGAAVRNMTVDVSTSLTFTIGQRRASATGVLRPEPMQAKRDSLTATPLAGHD
jgi:hypothetical protein